jgi:Fe/S biogenesis protein NfuA
MTISENPPITIDDQVLAMLLDVRSREPDAGDLGLVISISGISGASFSYDLAFMRVDRVAPDDIVVTDTDLPIIIPAADVANLQGARIVMSKDLLNPGLSIENPNSPSPAIDLDGISSQLTGTVAEQVVMVVNQAINPAIASHGGFVEVVAVEESTAYVRLGGGCQGCGLAPVTLSQGIETTIIGAVPEIAKVVDVTDHAEGANPYYEQSKK